MKPPHLILAGGGGFLGGVLAAHFAGRGWRVTKLTRRAPRGDAVVREVAWDGHTTGDWVRELDGADAVINLAGRSVDCRYTERNRREILGSRTGPTRALGEAIALRRAAARVAQRQHGDDLPAHVRPGVG
jgi:uncharacterized protein